MCSYVLRGCSLGWEMGVIKFYVLMIFSIIPMQNIMWWLMLKIFGGFYWKRIWKIKNGLTITYTDSLI